MKYIISGLLTLLIGITMALPAAVPVRADSGKNKVPPSVKKHALTIKVDNPVVVGQPVTITVLSRPSHETIAGAPVYAIKTENRVGPAGTDNYTTLVGEVEALMESNGTLLGTSGSDGRLIATVSEAGRYILIATKDGYTPGFARLQAKQKNENLKLRLILQAPTSTPAGQQITVKVTGGSSGPAVDNATISAIKTSGIIKPVVRPAPIPAENGTTTRMVISQQAPIMIDTEQEDALAGRLGKREIVLGSSNSAGEVVYTFTDAGTYMLLARKNGYLPGARRINVQSDTASKSLEIKATINLTTGQSSGVLVTEKGSSQPVEGAAVYSLKVENNRAIKQLPPTTNNFKAQLIRAGNDAARVKENGVLVGNTDSAGQVSYSFPSSGQYMLAAFKDGYRAAITRAGYFPPVSATTGANVTSTLPVTTTTTE
ncbi:MAG: hypothetical protein WC359_11140 [Dehalococcoidia bacterium]